MHVVLQDLTVDIEAVANREDMYFSTSAVLIKKTIFIPDVYDAMLRFEQEGLIRVVRYCEMPQERLKLLHDHILRLIIEEDMLSDSQTEQAEFYSTYFPTLWENAAKIVNAL